MTAADTVHPVLLDALWGALWPLRADPEVAALLLWLSDQLTWAAPGLS